MLAAETNSKKAEIVIKSGADVNSKKKMDGQL
ncbi:MAG: hypothetical protein ISN64_02340 [Rickettsia sp.]|nr:hypothetical protein [Rickettsia sp.]